MRKGLIILILIAAPQLSQRAQASLPPPFILKLLIKHATGILQTSEMIVSNTGKILKLRTSKKYEIFNKKSKLVLKGSGKEIDISELPAGKYTIRFDGDANQVESFEKAETPQG